LAYYFAHPDEKYYVRELASLVGLDVGNLSRELKNLEKKGLFLSSTKGRIKLYGINKDYPLYHEIKKLIDKTEGLEGGIREIVLGSSGAKAAFIYGSYASGKDKGASDIDLVVVGDLKENKFTREIRALESKFNKEINFTLYSAEDFRSKKKEKGGFLAQVLKEKLIILKGDPEWLKN